MPTLKIKLIIVIRKMDDFFFYFIVEILDWGLKVGSEKWMIPSK